MATIDITAQEVVISIEWPVTAVATGVSVRAENKETGRHRRQLQHWNGDKGEYVYIFSFVVIVP